LGTTSEELKRLYSNLGGDDKDTAKTQSPVEVLKKIYEYLGGENPNAKNVQQTGDILNKFNEMDIKLCVDERFYPPIIDEVKGNPLEFSNASEAPLIKCVTQITGSQDLHGYDKPWVGGAGKNLLQVTVENIKAHNTIGTWSGNTYTYNGITMSILTDSGNNVVGITINTSGATAETQLIIADIAYNADTAYYITSGASQSVSGLGMGSNGFGVWDIDQQRSIDRTGQSGFGSYIYYKVNNGATINNVTIYPMIRLSTESDPTFAPYSNICPITAYTEGEIVDRGKNLVDISKLDSYDVTGGGVYRIGVPVSLKAGIYTLSRSGGSSILFITNVTDNYSYVEVNSYPYTFTLANDSDILVRIGGSSLSQWDTTDLQIEKGSTATDYEPYKGTTHTTTYPSAIYRGSEDVVNGEVETTVKCYTPTSWSRTNEHSFYSREFIAELASTGNVPCICDKLRTWDVDEPTTNYGICFVNASGAIRINTVNAYASVEDMVADMGEMHFACTLPTPTTSSVTPTNLPIKSLSGYNHISSTTGDLGVEYITNNWNIFHPTIETESTKRKIMKRNPTRNLVLRVPIEDVEPTEEAVVVEEDIPEPTKEEPIVKKSVEEEPIKEDTTVEEVLTDEQQSV